MSRFSSDFQSGLIDLMRWRRDVRRFRTDPVDEALLAQCLDTFLFAPSVGLSEPWRIISVDSDTARAAALDNFRETNARALDGYSGDKAKLYSTLKLTGMQEAPVQLAVFCDTATAKGAGLGALTMPEMRPYSVVAAITQFWLYARAQGLGVGAGGGAGPPHTESTQLLLLSVQVGQPASVPAKHMTLSAIVMPAASQGLFCHRLASFGKAAFQTAEEL